MVMMATPIMGAAAPMFRHFTGHWEGGGVSEKLHNVMLNQADLMTLRNCHSVYQLMGPYQNYVHLQDENSPPLRGIEVEKALEKLTIDIYPRAVNRGHLLLNTLQDESGRCWLREYAPIGPYVGMDRNRKPFLWYQEGFVKKGIEFHREKQDLPPDRSVLIYGTGRPTVKSVLLRLDYRSVEDISIGLYRPEPFGTFLTGLKWKGDLLEACKIAGTPWMEIYKRVQKEVERIYTMEEHFPESLYPPAPISVLGPDAIPYQVSSDPLIRINSIVIPEPRNPDSNTALRAEKFVKHLCTMGIPAKIENSPGQGCDVVVSFPIKKVSVIVFQVQDILDPEDGDGTVPCWSMETQGLPETLPSYKVKLADVTKQIIEEHHTGGIGHEPVKIIRPQFGSKTHGQIARSDIVHSTIASDPEVQHYLRSILTGTMPEKLHNKDSLKLGKIWWRQKKP
jgi:hypothetical protein